MKAFSIEDEVLKSRSQLKATHTKTSNLYDDFGKLITRTLAERPVGVTDLIENFVEEVSEPTKVFRDEDVTKQNKIAQNHINLFESEYVRDEAGDQEEEFEIPIPNCLHMVHFFEQSSLGLSREEFFRVSLAMKYLVYNYPLTKCRFWGKLFGTEKNYYIAEVEYREGEGEEEAAEDDDEEKEAKNEDEANEEDGPAEEFNMPVNSWKPPPQIPKEDHSSGTNKYVYFVCNEPGQTWEKLPHVSPIEISIARQINKFFTGNLNGKVTTYPPYPGEESNYLRAQISRISASTQISPTGFFVFDEDDEEEEEEELHESYMPNSEFDGLSLRDLTDPSMNSWSHHSQYILPQGRCSWHNPYEKPEDDFEEEEDEEEEQTLEPVVVPETGPQLLSSVSDDKSMGHVPAWSTYSSSQVLSEYAVAVARSNIWPGAFAIAKGKIFDNIYVGWGKKYSLQNYAPPLPPPALQEFALSAEIEEMLDPSVDEEKALQEKKDALKNAEEMEEEDMDDEDEDED